MPYEPFDRNGKLIEVGSVVRIIGTPDLSDMSEESIAEVQPIFQYLLGKYKRVRGFNEYGHVELSFTMKSVSGKRDWHFIWIEPFLLQMPRQRSTV